MAGPTKAWIEPEVGERIDCLFNPAEFTLVKANTWNAAKPKGKNTPALTFQQGQSGTMTMTLTLDTTDTGEPVTTHTAALLTLMRVDTSLRETDRRRNEARPPWVRFHWGNFTSFKAVIERLNLRYTYFSYKGIALRAKVDISLKQFEDEENEQGQNPTSGTPAPERMHRVQPGETIDRITAEHLGDPTRWRIVAEANRITDPHALRPGQIIVIPQPSAVRRG